MWVKYHKIAFLEHSCFWEPVVWTHLSLSCISDTGKHASGNPLTLLGCCHSAAVTRGGGRFMPWALKEPARVMLPRKVRASTSFFTNDRFWLSHSTPRLWKQLIYLPNKQGKGHNINQTETDTPKSRLTGGLQHLGNEYQIALVTWSVDLVIWDACCGLHILEDLLGEDVTFKMKN